MLAIGGYGEGAVLHRHPEVEVDREPGGLDRGGRPAQGARGPVRVRGLGNVVDEPAAEALAEPGVRLGVEDERMPSFVDDPGRGRAGAGEIAGRGRSGWCMRPAPAAVRSRAQAAGAGA
ncbi:hypothetical protein GCM10018987_30240 [Streptomyces cremeus]